MEVVEPATPLAAAIAAAPEEWVASTDDETFNADPYPSLIAALQEAPRDLALEPGDRFFVGRRVPYRPQVDARAVIDQVGEHAFDDVGDAADEFLTGIADEELAGLQETMQIAFEAWLKHKGLEPNFWQVVGIKGCEVRLIGEGGYVVGD